MEQQVVLEIQHMRMLSTIMHDPYLLERGIVTSVCREFGSQIRINQSLVHGRSMAIQQEVG